VADDNSPSRQRNAAKKLAVQTCLRNLSEATKQTMSLVGDERRTNETRKGPVRQQSVKQAWLRG